MKYCRLKKLASYVYRLFGRVPFDTYATYSTDDKEHKVKCIERRYWDGRPSLYTSETECSEYLPTLSGALILPCSFAERGPTELIEISSIEEMIEHFGRPK